MEKEQILTHYVFLDTSVFIQENYFLGNKLKAFFKHAVNGDIALLTTEITIKECLANLETEVIDSYLLIKQRNKELNNKAKILKNIKSLDPLLKIIDDEDIKNETQNLIDKFVKNINASFEIVKVDNEILHIIIQDYFLTKPPFGKGKKKNKFPDAIVLNALKLWARKKKEKIYVVSMDSDMLSFESDELIPIKEYENLLDKISYTFSEENISAKIDELVERKEDDIIKAVLEDLLDRFPTEGFDESHGFEYEVNDVKFNDAFISNHSILYFTDNTATVELEVELKSLADISYDDVSMASYDREDDKWYNVEHVRQKISTSIQLEVSIEVSIELPGKYVWDEWEFKEITHGIPTDISIDD